MLSRGRRPVLAASLSIALNTGLVILAITLIGVHVVKRPPTIVLTDVEIVAPPPETPSGPDTQPAASVQKAGAMAKRGRGVPVARARTPTTDDKRAELAIRYEAPVEAPKATTGSTEGKDGFGVAAAGTGDGAGYGSGGSGLGLEVPAPPPSLARDPRPKRDYRRWTVPGAGQFTNQRIVVLLTLDPRGRVSKVELEHGVADWLDARAMKIAGTFEFEPALDDLGAPIASQYRWTFEIIDT